MKKADKKNKLRDIDFYFITDRNISKEKMILHAEDAVRAGVKIIQYRDDKDIPKKEKIKIAEELKKIAEGKAIFLINNEVDVCLAADADGVHLGQDDMPYEYARRLLGKDKIIGITVHNIKEAISAEKMGADYVALSPIFMTGTKENAGKPCGIGLIREGVKKIKIPITVIGGINRENINSVISAGAKSAVMVSAVLSKKDVFSEIKKIRKIINSQ